jgi:hypothetical protein
MKIGKQLLLIISICIVGICATFGDRKLQNDKFLGEMKEKNMTLYQKYISTKYLLWKQGGKGRTIKVGLFDEGVQSNICEEITFYNYTGTPDSIKNNSNHADFMAAVNKLKLRLAHLQ